MEILGLEGAMEYAITGNEVTMKTIWIAVDRIHFI